MTSATDPLREAADRFPSEPAIVDANGVLTHHQLFAWASGAAPQLGQRGLNPRDRLALVVEPSRHAIASLMGCFRSGVVACPINSRLPGAARNRLLEIAACREVSTPEEWDSPQERPGAPADSAHDVSADQPAVIVFTSGSTGDPKAALLSLNNLHHNAVLSNRNIPVVPGDRWLLSLPLYHVSGLGILFRCLAGGGAVALPGLGEAIEDAILRLAVTHVSLVPTQLRRTLRTEQGVRALKRLKAILLGGGPIPGSLLDRAAAHGLPVCTTYGLTEMASQVATSPLGQAPTSTNRGAPPLEPGTVAISNDNEILVRGNSLFLGYARGSEIVRSLTPDGWFPTGDLGAFDDSGLLHVHGRRDNRFISGGENIHPEEIERELCRIDTVLDAVVVPVDDDEYGQRPVAFLRTTEAEIPDLTTIARTLAPHLPSFKIPDAVFPWPVDLAPPGIKPPRPALARRAAELLAKS